jgi:hypothetical protein
METLFLGINISEWAIGGVAIAIAGFIVTLLRKKGFNTKAFLGRSARITKEIGEALLETSDVLLVASKAINDDNKLIENSVKDVIEAGKEAVLEWKDVIMVIKPKN